MEEELFFKDAFTEVDGKINVEMNKATMKCFDSSNQNFSMDCDGNLVCNTITTKTGSIGDVSSADLEEVRSAIPTKTSQLINDSNFVSSNILWVDTFEQFRNYFVNNAPVGTTNWTIVINGAFVGAVLMKANNLYLSYIIFGYGFEAAQHRYLNGAWYEKVL